MSTDKRVAPEDQLVEAFQRMMAVQASLVEAGERLGDALIFLDDGPAHGLMSDFSQKHLEGMEGCLELGKHLEKQGVRIR